MIGVILAGGMGTRLRPLTLVTNKHLLPIYNKPLIFYPIEKMIEAGIKEIVIITSTEYAGHFSKLLGDGAALGVRFHYATQERPAGIADALRLAQPYVKKEKLAVILGDNVFEDSIKEAVLHFENKGEGAAIFLKEHPFASHYGVVEFDKNGKIIDIEEKPAKPKTNMCATGIYFYDNSVFTIIDQLEPSKRGEYEITDVNRAYLKKGKLGHYSLKGEWFDCGSFYYLLKASLFVARKYNDFKEEIPKEQKDD